jgi:hypothetical protein
MSEYFVIQHRAKIYNLTIPATAYYELNVSTAIPIPEEKYSEAEVAISAK